MELRFSRGVAANDSAVVLIDSTCRNGTAAAAHLSDRMRSRYYRFQTKSEWTIDQGSISRD